MRNENKIFSIALEGLHRSGKGTQIELLKNKLKEVGIPCVSIKGEGYRQGLGVSKEDPESDFWKKISEQLKSGADWDLWDEASYRIELFAPKEILLTRLDASDQNYDFRKNNIENKYKQYIEAKEHLPEEIKNRIVNIDSSGEPDEVYKKILEEIKTRFPELKVLK